MKFDMKAAQEFLDRRYVNHQPTNDEVAWNYLKIIGVTAIIAYFGYMIYITS